MWENPQRFQGNYRESSLAQRGVLPFQLLIPTEEMGGLGEAAPALWRCPLPTPARSIPRGRGQSRVVHGPTSDRAPQLAQRGGTERQAAAELAGLIRVLQKGWKTSPRRASCLHSVLVL